MSTDPIEAYLKELRRRLRWRRGGRRMAEEVEDHLREHENVARGEGATGDDAARIAIDRVGDPAALIPGPRRATVFAGAALAVLAAVGIGLVAVDRSQPAAAPNAGYHLSPAQARVVARQVALIDQEYTQGEHQVSLEYAVETARFAVFLPNSPLANDGNVQFVGSLYGEGIAVVTVYRSGVLVIQQRWQAHASPLRWLERQPHFMWLGGAPASAVASGPPVDAAVYGFAPRIAVLFGTASVVYVYRDGTLVTLLRWGPHSLRGLIAVARTLHRAYVNELPKSASSYVAVFRPCVQSEMPFSRHLAAVLNRTPFPVPLNGCPVITPDRPLHHRA